jgi:hypothetical protein
VLESGVAVEPSDDARAASVRVAAIKALTPAAYAAMDGSTQAAVLNALWHALALRCNGIVS